MLIPAADSQTKSGRLWFHNRSFVCLLFLHVALIRLVREVLVAMSLSTLLAVPATLLEPRQLLQLLGETLRQSTNRS